jgi:hypothetical protein
MHSRQQRGAIQIAALCCLLAGCGGASTQTQTVTVSAPAPATATGSAGAKKSPRAALLDELHGAISDDLYADITAFGLNGGQVVVQNGTPVTTGVEVDIETDLPITNNSPRGKAICTGVVESIFALGIKTISNVTVWGTDGNYGKSPIAESSPASTACTS